MNNYLHVNNMSIDPNSDPRKAALAALANSFKDKDIPDEYAHRLAASVIFEADLQLRNAQLANILNWLKQEKQDIYDHAIKIVADTREAFEKSVQTG